jgi:AraC-like DNA-binding protein
MLIDTTQNITEVGYKCGFNNISNFNRIFRKKKGCTPKEFRDAYNAYGTRAFI